MTHPNRYKKRFVELAGLRERIVHHAQERPRSGYRTIHYFLTVDGWKVGRKQVYRIYKDAGLAVRRRKRRRRHAALSGGAADGCERVSWLRGFSISLPSNLGVSRRIPCFE